MARPRSLFLYALLASCGARAARAPLSVTAGSPSDPTGWIHELFEERLDLDPVYAESLRLRRPRSTWGPAPWGHQAEGEVRPELPLLRAAMEDASGSTAKQAALERWFRQLTADAAEATLAPPRGLLGPERGFPRKSILHLLHGFALEDPTALENWVQRLEDLVTILEQAPAGSASGEPPSCARAWNWLCGPQLPAALIETFDRSAQLLPALGSEQRAALRARTELAASELRTRGFATARARSSDPGAPGMEGLANLPGGLTIHRDRVRVLHGEEIGRRTLLDHLADLERGALAALDPGPAGEGLLRGLALRESNADVLDPLLLTRVLLEECTGQAPPTLARGNLIAGITDLCGPDLVVDAPGLPLRLLSSGPTGSTLEVARQAWSLLDAALARTTREGALAERGALAHAHERGWSTGLALYVLLRSEQCPRWVAHALLLEAVARARIDIGLHLERWDRTRAMAWLQSVSLAPPPTLDRWVDDALDRPAFALMPLLHLRALEQAEATDVAAWDEVVRAAVRVGQVPSSQLARSLGIRLED